MIDVAVDFCILHLYLVLYWLRATNLEISFMVWTLVVDFFVLLQYNIWHLFLLPY